MKFLLALDGYKTYIMTAVAVLFTLVEFCIKGDYSISSFIVLSQQTAVVAAIAALRHGISKSGNNGVVTTGGK